MKTLLLWYAVVQGLEDFFVNDKMMMHDRRTTACFAVKLELGFDYQVLSTFFVLRLI